MSNKKTTLRIEDPRSERMACILYIASGKSHVEIEIPAETALRILYIASGKSHVEIEIPAETALRLGKELLKYASAAVGNDLIDAMSPLQHFAERLNKLTRKP